MKVSIKVNGQSTDNDVEPRLLLVQYLRDVVGLTGTNIGCDTSSCGACTVHLDGEAVKSCTVLAVQADGAEVLTIEGLGQGEPLHPLQAAFVEHDAFQCGFCTPGQIMSAVGLIAEGQAGDDPERVRELMSGNICRCAAYPGITAAVLEASHVLSERSREDAA